MIYTIQDQATSTKLYVYCIYGVAGMYNCTNQKQSIDCNDMKVQTPTAKNFQIKYLLSMI